MQAFRIILTSQPLWRFQPLSFEEKVDLYALTPSNPLREVISPRHPQLFIRRITYFPTYIFTSPYPRVAKTTYYVYT